MVYVRVKVIEGGQLPERKTSGAVAFDCHARLENEIVIEHGERATIPLGFAMELPVGYELQIRPRSGLSKKGIDVALGTGDYDFTGEYTATVINNSHKAFTVNNGDRICQAAVREVPEVLISIVDKLKETERGSNGWGSTGIK